MRGPQAPTATDVLALVLGLAALPLSLLSGALQENWRHAAYGASLGAVANVFRFIWWLALLVAGVLLLVAIIGNIGDIFSY